MKKQKYILIVDDDTHMNALLADFLIKKGYQVKMASSVAGAMRWITHPDEHPFDLVISDVKLGGPSGLDLVKRLRAERPELPTILFSVFENVRDEAIESGASHFLKKPFQLEILARLLSDTLEAKA